MTHKKLNIFWILTLFIAPVTYAIYLIFWFESESLIDGLQIIPFLLIFSLFLSLPTLVIDHILLALLKHFGSLLEFNLPIL